MNQKLQNIMEIIQQSEKLDAEQKDNLLKAVKDADKELEITAFKLERTEKVKKTTAILLEETIEELEQKRKAVEAQNRELEIEASLERVRAVAMSMNKSDDLLSICEVSFKEFKKLGFDNLRNAIIHILNDEKRFFMDYDYSDYLDGSINKISYDSHPIVENYLEQIKKADDAFAEVVVEGSELAGWKDFRRRGGQQDDPKLNNIPALYYYLYSIGVGDIGISTLKPIDESHINILKRFRNVFNLAYQRYTDIAQAEAQAREAQIQLALERIRARTMAMQHSDELAETAFVLFHQFSELGEDPNQLSIGIFNEAEQEIEIWLSVGGNKLDRMFKASIDEPIVINKIYRAWKENKKSVIIDISGEELKAYNEFRNSLEEYKEYNDNMNSREPEVRRVMNCALFTKGLLSLATPELRPDETKKILERFAGVFDQTYTRFLDLQKAEAQAREAEIELALERVRARTMAMQKSDELKEVIQLVYEQFIHLNINVEHTGFVMDYKARDDYNIWIADPLGVPSQVTIPYFDSLYYNRFNEAKEKGEDFFATNLTFEEKNNFYKKLFKYIPELPEKAKEFYFSCSGLAASTVLLDNVCLYIENFDGIPYTDEENNILMRFGKVFQQTYTRFLDLQKAEKQAREAQIELALERIRARTMAMQKSAELAETAHVLYEQFGLLGENPEQLTIGIIDETHKIWEFWLTLGGNQINHVFKAPIDEPIVLNKSYFAWKERKKSIVIDISGDELKAYYNFFKNLPGYKEFNDYKNSQNTERRRVINSAFFSRGSLSLSSHEPKPAETIKLLERFAGVLDQTYTRFLDLKKAESQAREAQIELGLERVRARAMAMQNSNELSELVDTVFKELTKLDFALSWCIINIIDESSLSNMVWAANPNIDKAPDSYHMKFEDYPFHDAMMKGYKERAAKYIYVLEGIEKKVYDEYLFKDTEFRKVPEEAQAASKAMEKYVCSFTFSNFGGLQTVGDKPLSDINLDILARFGKVFDLTYTRFNDLKQAEAQARESEIELALERVRARTMGMQKSDELADTAGVLFEQMVSLGIVPKRCVISIINQATNNASFWLTSSDGKVIPGSDLVPLTEEKHLIETYKAWKEKKTHFSFKVHGQERLKWTKYVMDKVKMHLPEYQPETINKEQILNEPAVFNCLFFSHGFLMLHTVEDLSDDHIKMLKRFANVFEQTYTRFLDLKKAEEQAREAQIEAALERVRSRTMAMQESDELAETAAIVFRQLIALGIAPNRLYIGIIKNDSGEVEFWITDEDGTKVSQRFMGNVSRNLSMQKMYDGWKSKKKSLIIDMQGNELKDYFRYLGDELRVPFKLGLSQKRRIQNIAYFSKGFIGIASPDSQPRETIDLLERFAAVFNLTYTRFNDLQQAEAQNKLIQAENERKTMELEEARQLQLEMLPKELPQLPNLDIAVHMQTATEVGGDYYDFQVGFDGTLTTLIGDATGHGMKAGTVVTITKSLFNSMALNENILVTFDKISQVLKGMKFRHLAMCLIIIKIRGNRMSMSAAAMPPALIYRAKEKSVEEIFLKGMPLGSMNKFPYKKIENHLYSGDTILLYSDGLPELANDNGEMYGYDRIQTEFQSVGEKDPEEIVSHLKNSASQWANGKEPDDDVTFVVIKVK